jgi:uncharacterized membrane protein YphA (DoxX/SURF4 family)
LSIVPARLALNKKSLSCCCCSIVFFVALRILLGWHFYHEGVAHYLDKNWSSKGFLANSVGPFSSMAKSYVPDFHGWETKMNKPYEDQKEHDKARAAYNGKIVDEKLKPVLPPKSDQKTATAPKPEKSDEKLDPPTKPEEKPAALPKPEEKLTLEDPKHPFYKNPTYGDWANQIRADWIAQKNAFVKHYRGDDKPSQAIDEIVHSYLVQLEDKVTGLEKDLFEYRSNLFRVREMQAAPTHEIAFESERIAKLKTEFAGKPRPWLDDLQTLERLMNAEMMAVVNAKPTVPVAEAKTDKDAKMQSEAAKITAFAQSRPAFVFEKEPPYKFVDKCVTWLLIIGGVCLMIGLFTRTAAWACGLFLLSVVLMQPFWVSDAVNPKGFEQWVELLALFALGTSSIGQHFGLDYLISKKFAKGKCCGPQKCA